MNMYVIMCVYSICILLWINDILQKKKKKITCYCMAYPKWTSILWSYLVKCLQLFSKIASNLDISILHI